MGFARVGSNPTVVDHFLFALAPDSQSGPSGAMDSASDFGSGGWGFESPLGLLFFGVAVVFFFCFVFGGTALACFFLSASAWPFPDVQLLATLL